MTIFNRLFIRLKLLLRNNFILFPNLIRGNKITRIFVLSSWLNNNVTLLLSNSSYKKFQHLILLGRTKSPKKTYSNTIPEYTKSKLNTLEIHYINLEHRKDRDREIVDEFKILGLNNYIRFNAIKNTNGALGCALSHMTILENWNTYNSNLLMVCEDDLKFIGSLEELEVLVNEFINDKSLDILCLSYNQFNEVPYNEMFNLTSDTQTTACYIVKPHMKTVLLENFKLSVKLLENKIDNQYGVAIDEVWKVLQKKYNFVLPKKRFAHQRESYSDIMNRVVDYKV